MANKRLQNQVADSRLALPVMSACALLVWLTAGLVTHQWWGQLVCYAASTALVVELNNSNALLRVYSRMVSCSFLLLSCMAGLFCSLPVAIVVLCLLASYTTLFRTYQDRQATGWTFYAFLIISLASLANVHVLYFVPVIWLLMATNLISLSWRTFWASLLGLLTPYWFYACYLLYQADFTPLFSHFAQLARFSFPFDYTTLRWQQLLTFGFLVALAVTGTVHFMRKSYQDKIRIRLLFGFFIAIDAVAIVLMVLLPQHYELLTGIIIVNTSPLLAHFVTLTHTRITNVAFCVIVIAATAITVANIWGDQLIALLN